MKNSEKLDKIRQITVQDVIDWLDGRVIAYVVTEKNMDTIDNRYCSKKIFHTVFSKKRYNRVNLSNGRWMDSAKPFISEFEAKKNEYWKTLSKNSVRKCESVDDMLRILVRAFSSYLQFKIDGRGYDYINIKSIIAKDSNVYTHDKSEDIKSIRSKIWDLEKEKKMLETKLHKLEYYQSIHTDLEKTVKDTFYTEGNHYL